MIISLVGNVSSGKSSFINSLVGFPIANVSLQRETFKIHRYIYCAGADLPNYDKINATNKSERVSKNDCHPLEEVIVKSPFKFFNRANIEIIDFPGIDDSDKRFEGYFEKIMDKLKQSHLIIFVSEAQRSFQSVYEKKNLETILSNVKKWRSEGNFCGSNILINKYDDSSDTDLKEIFEQNVSKKFDTVIFRYCSYAEFKKRFKALNVKSLKLPDTFRSEIKKIKAASEPAGDFDGIVESIQSFSDNFTARFSWFALDYLLSIIPQTATITDSNYKLFTDLQRLKGAIKCLSEEMQNGLFTKILSKMTYIGSSLFIKHLEVLQLINELSCAPKMIQFIIKDAESNIQTLANCYKVFGSSLSLEHAHRFKKLFKERVISEGSYKSLYDSAIALSKKEGWEIIEDHHDKTINYEALEMLNIDIKVLLRVCYNYLTRELGKELFDL